jgi:predicted ribosomally synthesized peptide with nif11-like leader
MSAEQLKTFLETVKADAILQKKLKAAADAEAAVAIAKEVGIVVSTDEAVRAIAELSDDKYGSWLL